MSGHASLLDHVVHALTLHRKWCRQTGVRFPAVLDAFLVDLTADSGHERPTLGVLGSAADPLLVDYEEAGQRLSVSARTVRRLVAAGSLPAVRLGGRSLIRVDALKSYVDGIGGGEVA